MENKIKKNEDSNVIDKSSGSIREDFLRNNQEFYEKGIENSFKTLNTNIFSTINSSFANFDNDYEMRLDVNREIHEKAMGALTDNLKKIKDNNTIKKGNLEKVEESLDYLVTRIYKYKVYSKVFRQIKAYYTGKKFTKAKNKMIIDNFLKIKKKRNIFNSWRNITSSMSKGRIKLKYGKIFNEKYTDLQSNYITEIKRLADILQSLEIDIKKEIDERRALAQLYDSNMNKGVEVFIKETNAINDFNSSSKIFII